MLISEPRTHRKNDIVSDRVSKMGMIEGQFSQPGRSDQSIGKNATFRWKLFSFCHETDEP